MRLDTEKIAKDLYHLARQRDRATKDGLGRWKCIKGGAEMSISEGQLGLSGLETKLESQS